MSKKIVVLLFVFIGLLQSCNTTEPPPLGEKITLTLILEDVSSIEAWITLATTNLQLPKTITLEQNDQTRSIINLVNGDTLLYIDSLLPNQTYSFHTTIQPSNQAEVKSNVLNVTTMDTTSHNFTWQTWTFGEHGNSVLRDVAIIDENNIWAVGEIFMNDSLGQPDSQPYAVAHWDGSNWSLIKVSYHDFNQTAKSPGPLFTVDIIEGEIYVVSFANLLKRAGNDWEEKAFFMDQIPFDGQVLKIWGADQNNIYCVGRNGAIYYYYGSGWQKIESGTNIDLRDIWGTDDGSIIWVTGYDSGFFNTVLLMYNGTNWEKLYEGSPNNQNNNYYIGLLRSVWTNSNLFTYLMNDEAIYRQYDKSELDLIRITGTFGDVGLAMRGNDKNNLFIAGQHGLVGHYNGFSFKEFTGLKNNNDYLYAVDVKNNTVCIVGERDQGVINDKAIVHLIK